ncbi:MAG: thioredoxin domain-containing protein [Anaerolineales bacterium]
MSRKQAIAKRKATRRSRWIRYTIIGLVLAGSALAWIATRPPAAAPASEARITEQHSRGPADAPVTIVEYGDFNCPTCRAFYRSGILDKVRQDYPDSVRIVFRHFPVITPASPQLAEGAECAADQGAFWMYHDSAYDSAPLSPSDVTSLAQELGLEMDSFDRCYQSRRYAGLVQAETDEAFGYGFRGTPSFVVNGQALAGPPSYELLASVIDSALGSTPQEGS